ncbi:hypothetical protein [Roseibium sp.]|uniref:hypothetical protein n=1 Tax=Roseibium sp. TaxID=1936156 RepID=UPI00391CEEAA
MSQRPRSTPGDWVAARAENPPPVDYFHWVFTLPPEIARIVYLVKNAVYWLLFKASAESLLTLAADPKQVGMTCVLHTWDRL